jgi:membrane-bound lytic murein transglycosylase B
MQFMPKTWTAYGVDGDEDGDTDTCSVVDAMYGASRLLGANYQVSGAWDMAIWQYNHDWGYVADVQRMQNEIEAK